MTDKVQKIREEVERLFNHVKDSDFESDSGAFYYLKDLLDFMDSLQEEPVNKDLEDASNNALDKISKKYDIVNIKSCLEMFRLGAGWQKNQMMEKAVETTFNVSLPSGLYDKLWIKNCKEGDKLLVIKKEEL